MYNGLYFNISLRCDCKLNDIWVGKDSFLFEGPYRYLQKQMVLKRMWTPLVSFGECTRILFWSIFGCVFQNALESIRWKTEPHVWRASKRSPMVFFFWSGRCFSLVAPVFFLDVLAYCFNQSFVYIVWSDDVLWMSYLCLSLFSTLLIFQTLKHSRSLFCMSSI